MSDLTLQYVYSSKQMVTNHAFHRLYENKLQYVFSDTVIFLMTLKSVVSLVVLMRIICDTRCVSVCCSRLQIALLREINAESGSWCLFLEKQQLFMNTACGLSAR